MRERSTFSRVAIASLTAVAATLCVAGTAQAYATDLAPKLAYLDPVTGALIVQGVIAAIATIVVKTKSLKRKVKGWFGMTETPEPEITESERSEP